MVDLENIRLYPGLLSRMGCFHEWAAFRNRIKYSIWLVDQNSRGPHVAA